MKLNLTQQNQVAHEENGTQKNIQKYLNLNLNQQLYT